MLNVKYTPCDLKPRFCCNFIDDDIRDIACFATIDNDWPKARAVFETWLDEGDFDGAGRQRMGLKDIVAESRVVHV